MAGVAAAYAAAALQPDALFWAAALAAAPQWTAAVLFPRAPLTQRLWRPQYAALPLALAFSAAVLPHLAWWLTRFARADLSLANLSRDFAAGAASSAPPAAAAAGGLLAAPPPPGWPFLLLWLYILAFDIEVFAHMHARLRARGSSAVEMSLWALVTALCAPLGYALFTLLEMLTRDARDIDEAAERAAAAARYAGRPVAGARQGEGEGEAGGTAPGGSADSKKKA